MPSLHLSGKVTGSNHLSLTGNGTLYLTNQTNDFIGDIFIGSGVLATNSDLALGAFTNRVVLQDAVVNSTFRATDTFDMYHTIRLGNTTTNRNILQVTHGHTLHLWTGFEGQNGFVKGDNGTLALYADNSQWNGNMIIHSGVMEAHDWSALGSDQGTLYVSNTESALHLYGTQYFSKKVHLFGTGIQGTGALYAASGDITWSGGVVLDGDASIGVAAGSRLTINDDNGSFAYNPLNTNTPISADQFELTLTGEGDGRVDASLEMGSNQLIKSGTGTSGS